MHATIILGITTSDGGAVCVPCTIEAGVATGDFAPAARDLDFGTLLDQFHGANALDAGGDGFMHPVFASDDGADDTVCDACLTRFIDTV